MSFGPSRGGTRGGQDRFTWDDVKGDKYKEFYLGQSLKLRPSWFSQEMEGKKKEAAAVVDKDEIKKMEEQLMKEALGLVPKQRRNTGKTLEKHELAEACARGAIERDPFDITRVAGLGFAPAPSHSSLVPETPLLQQTPRSTEVAEYVKAGKKDDDDKDERSDKKHKKHKHDKKDKDKKHKKHKDKKHKDKDKDKKHKKKRKHEDD